MILYLFLTLIGIIFNVSVIYQTYNLINIIPIILGLYNIYLIFFSKEIIINIYLL